MKEYNELLHLPDFKFSKYCELNFYINKGIYNTIDEWFYRRGIVNILERREKIFQFLLSSCSNKEKVKFGPGGLTKALEKFWYQQDQYKKNNGYIYNT